ncbi:putative membrane protein [Mycobacterium xenopi 4042]|uniref:Putative membrane protein n=1 Tax=Mycobacterium xenopi 4042 TaxID=1299334 RepID=X8EFA1_MYCXE|nr:putative membrane protein [Mycobacterium xenopi 4042]
MTSSQWLDIAVLAVAFIAAISGWRSGAMGSLLSFVGVMLGAVAGVLLARTSSRTSARRGPNYSPRCF